MRSCLCRFLSYSPLRIERIDKILTLRGVKSRSEASKLLQQGKVKVNGQLVRGRGDKFPLNSEIKIASVDLKPLPVLVAFHKPLGVISSIGDPWNRPNLSSVIAQHPLLTDMHPVGRLDQDTSGLLLFSRDGELTNFILSPESKIEREYEATVTGEVNFDKLYHQLQSGVETKLGVFSAHLLESKTPPTFPTSSTASCLPNPHSIVRLIVTEGKYRMVRKILHNSGHSVVSLQRIRYGQISLGNQLEGTCRSISNEEFTWVVSLFQHKTIK